MVREGNSTPWVSSLQWGQIAVCIAINLQWRGFLVFLGERCSLSVSAIGRSVTQQWGQPGQPWRGKFMLLGPRTTSSPLLWLRNKHSGNCIKRLSVLHRPAHSARLVIEGLISVDALLLHIHTGHNCFSHLMLILSLVHMPLPVPSFVTICQIFVFWFPDISAKLPLTVHKSVYLSFWPSLNSDRVDNQTYRSKFCALGGCPINTVSPDDSRMGLECCFKVLPTHGTELSVNEALAFSSSGTCHCPPAKGHRVVKRQRGSRRRCAGDWTTSCATSCCLQELTALCIWSHLHRLHLMLDCWRLQPTSYLDGSENI